MEPESIIIREILLEDAEAAANLSGQLGYPAATEEMRERIKRLAAQRGHQVFVAVNAHEVVGWIDVSRTQHLQTEPYAEIGGLVVATEFRGAGIGARLVARVEQWAKKRGLRHVLVRSQVMREAAHRFYLREGYQRTKTSAVFMKRVEP